MNIQRMIKAAEWMLKIHEAGDSFNLLAWRGNTSNAKTYPEFHKCGSSACFGGWLAVSPDFRKEGGSVDLSRDGAPKFGAFTGFNAMTAYFECEDDDDFIYGLAFPGRSHDFYRKSAIKVTALDVAEKLLELIKAEVANG